MIHAPRIKWEHWAKVCPSKLQESLEEKLGIRLHFDQSFNFARGFAHIKTLEDEQFSQRDLVNLDLIQLFVDCRKLTVDGSLALLLNTDDSILVDLASAVDIVNRINF